MKICILYGGVSTERDVSINTGKSVFNSIFKDFNIFLYDFDGNYNKLYDKLQNTDLVFIALHGGDGENGRVQNFLESKDIKFTGSSSEASQLAMDKNIVKLLCKEHSIPTPNWVLNSPVMDESMKSVDQFIDSGFVIKPVNEGSSFGITIFKKIPLEKEFRIGYEKAIKLFPSVMFEEYIPGRELTVSILDNRTLPVIEIVPKGDYYDFKSKYTKFQSDYVVPAKIDRKTEELLSTYSLNIHRLVGCGVYSRSDFRLSEDGSIYFLEINTLPGFTDTSLFPKSALSAGINYNKLINKIIKLSI